ncbi:MAG: hypothetical protein K0B07_01575 [DPANN group archaeon]|nr:hypothetical protein [DPANN group archaeon]
MDNKKTAKIEEIIKKTGLTKKDILKQIEAKEKEFEGLVSEDGAIYIIGKEAGLDLAKPKVESLKINNIVPNMRQINLIAKIIFISPIRTFKKGDTDGKVLNLTLGDTTGTITISIWNEDVEKLKDLKAEDVIEIKNGYSKNGYLGKIELVLTSRSEIEKSDEMIETQELTQQKPKTNKTNIVHSLKSIKEYDRVKIKGCLASIYEKKIVHNLCPECRKKTDDNDNCQIHGKVIPNKFLIISGTIDDGQGRINAVFFNDAVESLLQKKAQEIDIDTKNTQTRKYLSDKQIFGKDFEIEGTIKKNRLTGSEELHITVVNELNIGTEIKNNIKELEV